MKKHTDIAEIPTDWAEKWAQYSAQKVAFKEYESGEILTFGELDRLGNWLSEWLLQEKKLQKGDRLGIIAENCLDYILLFVAAQKTGIILLPLNYRLSASEIGYLMEDASPSLMIVEQKFSEKITESSVEQLSLSAFREMWHNRELQASADFRPSTRQLDETALILYTSGSTGFPKGVRYTHGMLFWNSINTAFSVEVNSNSRTVTVMPPFHTGGWNVLLTPFFHHGGYTCLMKSFDATAVVQALDEEQATIFMGVPTMLKMMADSEAFAPAHFDSVLYFLVGGEAMPIPLIKVWTDKGVYIRQGYGMTEAGPNLTSLHHHDAIRKAGSIGRPNFMVQIRIVDEQGADCPANHPGELLIRGPMVTPGYWHRPDATAENIKEGWLSTGDRVVQDEEGFLYVVDRIKNMFISGGENVYPAEIERVLLSHPDITEAAVIGVADAKWGEVGKAFWVAKEGNNPSLEQIQDFCRQKLAKYKIPKHFVQVESLPKGDTGKIDRKALKSL